MNKKELRAAIKAKKEQISPQEKALKSKAIMERVKASDVFRNATNVLCYWSMDDEVCTHDFIVDAAQSKRVFLPVVAGDKLLLRRFSTPETLCKGAAYAIPEPNETAESCRIDAIDLVVVPGVAFDKRGGRLGRGKGFYDRLLNGSRVYKLGVCFDFQFTDQIPTDEHDVLMDAIIYE